MVFRNRKLKKLLEGGDDSKMEAGAGAAAAAAAATATAGATAGAAAGANQDWQLRASPELKAAPWRQGTQLAPEIIARQMKEVGATEVRNNKNKGNISFLEKEVDTPVESDDDGKDNTSDSD